MVEIYNHVRNSTDENIFFSPFCLSTSLAMISQGSAGNTLEQFEKVLGKAFIIKHGFYHASRMMESNANFRQVVVIGKVINKD
jgi:serine protease inhibitor